MNNRSKKPDTSGELLIQPWGNGVRLISPEQVHEKEESLLYSVSKMLKLPFNVYFMNTDSALLRFNEHVVANCGFASAKDALGNSVQVVAKKEVAEFVMAQDQLVMQSNKKIILDVNYRRLRDDAEFPSVVLKFPWYGADNKIHGIFGCAIVLKGNNAQALSSSILTLSQAGILAPNTNLITPSSVGFNSTLTGRIIHLFDIDKKIPPDYPLH